MDDLLIYKNKIGVRVAHGQYSEAINLYGEHNFDLKWSKQLIRFITSHSFIHKHYDIQVLKLIDCIILKYPKLLKYWVENIHCYDVTYNNIIIDNLFLFNDSNHQKGSYLEYLTYKYYYINYFNICECYKQINNISIIKIIRICGNPSNCLCTNDRSFYKLKNKLYPNNSNINTNSNASSFGFGTTVTFSIPTHGDYFMSQPTQPTFYGYNCDFYLITMIIHNKFFINTEYFKFIIAQKKSLINIMQKFNNIELIYKIIDMYKLLFSIHAISKTLQYDILIEILYQYSLEILSKLIIL